MSGLPDFGTHGHPGEKSGEILPNGGGHLSRNGTIPLQSVALGAADAEVVELVDTRDLKSRGP